MYKVKSWSELVKGALVAGVSASVGRIAMQEWLNRTYGPKTSYGVTPKPPPCTCDLNEVAEDETLLDEATQLKSSLAPTGANEIPAVAPTETNVTLANISTNDLQNSTALLSSSISRTSTLKPVRSLARRFMTETEILGWEKLVSVALNVGVSASVGRIVMQEFLNRRWGPRDSWGDRPQSFITCDCQALVKLNVTGLLTSIILVLAAL
ncbi:hypothetical protein FRB97_000413 [Tulasnella sp. 331]|nr:hypothetical protein FRB97_000413 [Tulasnella sp. 331]KAG8889980.1 hypothetical protein FRB98_001715 [Tulasnella sp. 332]